MNITPSTVVDLFGIAISYAATLDFSDGAGAGAGGADEEATQIYQLLAQGGAINDFQVYFPLGAYLEKGTPLYVHFFGGHGSIAAGGTMVARAQVWTLSGGSQ
jgi:hypothetical protein